MANLLDIPRVRLVDASGNAQTGVADFTGTNARLDVAAAKQDALNVKFPTAIGPQPLAGSLSVTPVTPDTLPTMGLQQTLTVDGTSRSLPAPTTGGSARYAFIQALQPLWYRVDGQPATAGLPSIYVGGGAGTPGSVEVFSVTDLAAFRYISGGTGSGASVLLRG